MTRVRAPSPGKSPGADDAQRRASDPEASVWVSANAGSGKTHALTTRVARLLLAGNAPERILCLTFTKAAAAEMSARLYKRLGDWAMMDDKALAAEIRGIEGDPPDAAMLKDARKLFARAIETPGGLKIQTIHAFCERLLGRFPLEAGVPPHFDILDERAATELMAEVRDAVLRRAGTEEGTALSAALVHVVARVDELAFGNLLKEITTQRGNFSELMKGLGGLEGIRAALRHALSVGPDETVEGLRAAIADLPEAEMRAAQWHFQVAPKPMSNARKYSSAISRHPKPHRYPRRLSFRLPDAEERTAQKPDDGKARRAHPQVAESYTRSNSEFWAFTAGCAPLRLPKRRRRS